MAAIVLREWWSGVCGTNTISQVSPVPVCRHQLPHISGLPTNTPPPPPPPPPHILHHSITLIPPSPSPSLPSSSLTSSFQHCPHTKSVAYYLPPTPLPGGNTPHHHSPLTTRTESAHSIRSINQLIHLLINPQLRNLAKIPWTSLSQSQQAGK